MVTERWKRRKRRDAARREQRRKNGSSYSGGIGMERGEKLQGKRLESRGRLRWRRMRAG